MSQVQAVPNSVHSFRLLLMGLVCSVSVSAWAGTDWETVATEPYLVKIRDKAGTPYKEVWAEGEIAAPVQDIQKTLMTPNVFERFMPYVKESALIGLEPDGTQYAYTRLELPFLQSRDYVVKVYLIQGVAADGSGNFENKWVAEPDKIEKRRMIIRLRHNEGSWLVTPKPNGKSHAVYHFSFDPGGWVPGFVADMGNKQAVQSTFQAVEKEAQRRAAVRKQKEKADAGSPPSSVSSPLQAADAGTAPMVPVPVAPDAGTRPLRPRRSRAP